jgi:hypothetical protein
VRGCTSFVQEKPARDWCYGCAAGCRVILQHVECTAAVRAIVGAGRVAIWLAGQCTGVGLVPSPPNGFQCVCQMLYLMRPVAFSHRPQQCQVPIRFMFCSMQQHHGVIRCVLALMHVHHSTPWWCCSESAAAEHSTRAGLPHEWYCPWAGTGSAPEPMAYTCCYVLPP